MRPEEDPESSADSSSEGDLADVFQQLLLALQLNPGQRLDRKQEFLCFLGELCTHFSAEENYQELLDCYHQALALYPDSEEILYNLGALLLRYNIPFLAASM